MPASLFRERDSQDVPDHSELTDQFLHEIEKAQEHERQDRYKEALRNLWEKYQQQENQIEGDIYEEQKKRMRMPPYYMLMQKKRSYPVLPWLPYSADRKKRFPVSKRSTPHVANEGPLSNMGKTDENVERELSELFGTGTEEKKKRSIDNNHSKPAATHAPDAGATTDMRLELESANKNNATKDKSATSTTADVEHQHAGHSMKEHKHGKRSNHPGSHESHEEEGEEEEEESDEEHDSEEDEEEREREHEHEHDHEDHEVEDEAKRKKKRDTTFSKKKRNANDLRRTMDDFNVMRSKKSVDWSKYFGIDRKKKALPIVEANKE